MKSLAGVGFLHVLITYLRNFTWEKIDPSYCGSRSLPILWLFWFGRPFVFDLVTHFNHHWMSIKIAHVVENGCKELLKWQGHLVLDQVAQSPCQPGHEHFQGCVIHIWICLPVDSFFFLLVTNSWIALAVDFVCRLSNTLNLALKTSIFPNLCHVEEWDRNKY